jgi:hypothetical protein
VGSTDQAQIARNTLHTHRVVADVFIAAEGRPFTIDEHNWTLFLGDNGTPSSKVIIEAVRNYVSPRAGELLFVHCKLPIVKYSSALKGAAILSSYETLCHLLLTEEQFHHHQANIFRDVARLMREKSRSEASLLFQEFRSRPGSLPKFSQDISTSISRLKAAISKRLDETQEHLGLSLAPHPLNFAFTAFALCRSRPGERDTPHPRAGAFAAKSE